MHIRLKGLGSLRFGHGSFLFLNAGRFAAAFALIVKLGTTYAAGFVYHHGLNVGREKREQPLHAYAVRNFSNGERSGSALALGLNHVAAERLDALLVSFNDFIVNGDVVTGFKPGKSFFIGQLFVNKGNSGLHNKKFREANVGETILDF